MPTAYAGTDTFAATFDIPSGGDARNAASVNTGLEALGDRTTWLKNRAGLYRLVQVSDAYKKDTALSVLGSSNQATFGTGDVKIGGVMIEENDIVKVRVDFHASASSPVPLCGYRLAYSLDGGTKTAIPGSGRIFSRAMELVEPISLSGQAWFGVGEAGSGSLDIYIQMTIGTGETIYVVSPMNPWIEVLRYNA